MEFFNRYLDGESFNFFVKWLLINTVIAASIFPAAIHMLEQVN